MDKEKLIEMLKRNIRMTDKSDSMLNIYPAVVKRYLDWLDNEEALKEAKIAEQYVQDYLFQVKEQRLKDNPNLNPLRVNTSLNLKLYALIYFYRNVLRVNIHISPFRAVSKESPILTAEELRTLIMSIDNLMYRVYVGLAYELALRVNEAIRLKVKDVDKDKWWVYIKSSKGGRSGWMPVFDYEIKELLNYWLNNNRSSYIFPGKKAGTHISERALQKQMLKYGNNIGIDISGATTHFLRHSRQQQLMNAGWSQDMRVLFLRQKTGRAIEKYEHEITQAIIMYEKEKPLPNIFEGLKLWEI